MARGNLQTSSRYCGACGKYTKFEKNTTIWGLGDFVMVVITSGLWVIGKLIINSESNPWRCSMCGSKG